MRARTTTRGARFRAIAAGAAVVTAAAFLAFRSERGEARAAPAVSAAPAAAAPAAAPPPGLPAAAQAAPAVATDTAAQPAPAPASGAEEQLMERVRAEVDEHPEVAIALAEQGEGQFPGGASSDERALLRMRALVHLEQIGIARDAAREFFERHPDSPLGRDVFRLTGMRPPPVMGPRS
jgi:hypothetical protein